MSRAQTPLSPGMNSDAVALQAERRILLLRSQGVMLDFHLAELYGVQTKALNQAVKRNLERFPEDFAFQLTPEEDEALRSQIVTSKPRKGSDRPQTAAHAPGRGGRRYLPYAFTEQGVAVPLSRPFV